MLASPAFAYAGASLADRLRHTETAICFLMQASRSLAGLLRGISCVLAMVAIAAPAFAQGSDPFLSVAPTPRPAPAPAHPTPPRAVRPAAPPPHAATPSPAAPAPPKPIPTSFAEKGFHCPPAGTTVVREGAGKSLQLSYGGAEPGDAEACVMALYGTTASYLFGIYNKRAENAAEAAEAYRKVLTGPPGTTANFRVTLIDDSSYIWNLRNEALETLVIGGKPRPAVRIARTETGVRGSHFRGTWTDWYDVGTGVMVRQSYQHEAGPPPDNQDWAVTSLNAP